ncbi:MAG: hypothetical protein CVU09_12925 [Bacteroidetes bacterium HGW-Bacteroidetes-4]|jgi:hypothetical protein|nr:MAG: hypothetical protein CVU09_12925 [Bacteroidetes bacterium HGW-Bacteroidetes-4]
MNRSSYFSGFGLKKVTLFFASALILFACETGEDPLPDDGDENPDPIDEELVADIKIDLSAKVAISPMFFGQNYWSWVSEWGAQVNGTEELMQAVGLNLLRLGGSEPDRNFPEAFDYAKIDEAMAYANKIGTEVMLQIPLLNDHNAEPITVKKAMDIVRYVREMEYPIRYFAIGNEPDIYVEQGMKTSYTVNDLTAQFNVFSDSIKAIDPEYQVMGPDLAWKYYPDNNWLQPFLSASKDKLDVVTLHRYPFAPDDCTIENVKADAEKFRSDLRMIRNYMKNLGMNNNFPLAITETHVSYDGNPQYMYSNASPASFWAALWVADVIGVGMEEGLWNLSFWSISEGWTLGFIDGELGEPRPSYHALKLISTHSGNQSLGVQHNLEEVAVYATQNAETNQVFLYFINKQESPASVKWQFTGSDSIYTQSLNPISITLFEIKGDEITEHWEYNQEMANSGSDPVLH